MSYVPIEGLLAKTGSIYQLVVLASKRASELNAGAPKLVDVNSEKLASVALEEIAQDKVKIKTKK